MKFAVTGGLGFIGSNIVKSLASEGHDVTIIDNFVTGKKENLGKFLETINFVSGDICNNELMNNVLSDVDGIFHQAALTSVPESFEKPEIYQKVNVEGTENIFQIAEKNKIKVVYASSSSVYGNIKKIPINEKNDRNPINPYGKTKLDDEKLAEKYFSSTKIVGLRYFNVFGKGQTGNYAGVIPKFLECIKQDKPLTIFGNGEQIRDFIHVKDVTNANIIAMNSKIDSGFFNIGTGKTTSIRDLADIMIKISGHKQGIKNLPPLEGDVDASQADTAFTKKMLGWTYKIELEEGLQELLTN